MKILALPSVPEQLVLQALNALQPKSVREVEDTLKFAGNPPRYSFAYDGAHKHLNRLVEKGFVQRALLEREKLPSIFVYRLTTKGIEIFAFLISNGEAPT